MTTPTPAVDIEKPTRRPATPAATAELPKPRRLASYVPDHRWAHPLEAALWALVLALVASVPAFHIPPWTMGAIGLVAATVGIGRARRCWRPEDYGEDIRSAMSMLAIVSGVFVGAWLIFAVATHPFTAVGLLALITVFCGGWYAHLRTIAKREAKAIEIAREEAEAAREQAQLDEAVTAWNAILASVNQKLKVVEIRPTRAGYVLGVEPSEVGKAVSFASLTVALPDLTVKASAALASTGVTIRAGDIRLEETAAAHVHLIHVCTKHVLSEVIPFEPIAEPTSAKDPADFALYEDGREVTVTVAGETGGTNGKVVGTMGSGKTTTTNSMIGRNGECVDLLIGVVANSKLVPLVYPWLKPWLEGKTAKPAIDFVAGQSPQQVLNMLAGLYLIVTSRNAKLSNNAVHVVTPAEPAIVLYVEEAGKMAPRRETVLLHTGQRVHFSQLIDMICSEDRAAMVSLFLLNQNDLYGSLGEYGAEIARNTPFRICLKTLAPQDGTSVLPGLNAAYSDTSKLRHHSMLVQPSIDEPRVMRAKSYSLVGTEQIYPIALRNAAWRPELEPDLAALLGDVWHDRWNADRLPELAAAARADGLEWPVTGKPVDPIEAELHNMIAQTMASDSPTADDPRKVGDIELPDPAVGVAELNAITNKPALTLPEPLQSVMKLLAEEPAPKDWISTQQLAILLERVAPDADVAERKAAAQKLGRELSTIDERIRAEPKDRMQGYDVPRLKKLAAEIARGAT